MKNKSKGIKEGNEAEIHIESLRAALIKIANWKAPDHNGIHGFW